MFIKLKEKLLTVFGYLDQNCSGKIDADQFFAAIVPKLDPFKENAVIAVLYTINFKMHNISNVYF